MREVGLHIACTDQDSKASYSNYGQTKLNGLQNHCTVLCIKFILVPWQCFSIPKIFVVYSNKELENYVKDK
jgi:hypothetical protein